MKKLIFTVICITIATFTFAGMSYAWQGRMAGMGDPYGLVQDESDFLIHPSMLLDGTSIKFYGNYRYTYTDVMDWDSDWDDFNGPNSRWYRASGDEQEHNTLLGAAFPFGPGRMGAFFSYDGQRNDYDRDWKPNPAIAEAEYDFENQLDNFAIRILYGLPLNGFSIGGEVGCEYRDEESTNFRIWNNTSAIGNNPSDTYGAYPYESNYWNAFLKGSIQGNIGNIPTAFTLRGGYIFTGESELDNWLETPVGTTVVEADPEGDINGYTIGGDLWFRFPICEGLTMPHLIRIDYQEKKRTGDGTNSDGSSSYYKANEKRINIEAGGGFDRKCSENDSRLAGGIYYNYIENSNDFYYKMWAGTQDIDEPHYSEHRVIARMIWEKPLSSNAELRTAMNWFYGNVEKKFRYRMVGSSGVVHSYIKGPHWGVDVSLGCTLAINSFSIEPFINGGYQEYDLDGDIDLITDDGDADESREQWFIGGGFSLLFGN